MVEKLVIMALAGGCAVAAVVLVKATHDAAAWVKNRAARWNSVKLLEERNKRLGEELIEARAELGVTKAQLNRANVVGSWVDDCKADDLQAQVKQLQADLVKARRLIDTLKKQVERSARNA